MVKNICFLRPGRIHNNHNHLGFVVVVLDSGLIDLGRNDVITGMGIVKTSKEGPIFDAGFFNVCVIFRAIAGVNSCRIAESRHGQVNIGYFSVGGSTHHGFANEVANNFKRCTFSIFFGI
jgi:hypothetical protein